MRIHYNTARILAGSNHLNKENYPSRNNCKAIYIFANLPPGDSRYCCVFSRLVDIWALKVHGRSIPLPVDGAPEHGGLVHVLVVLQPHLHHGRVVELAAEGDLALVEVVGLPHLDAVEEVSDPVEELRGGGVLRLAQHPARVPHQGAGQPGGDTPRHSLYRGAQNLTKY